MEVSESYGCVWTDDVEEEAEFPTQMAGLTGPP